MLDAVEIESAKLWPTRTNDQRVGTLGSGIGGVAITHRSIQARFGFGNSDGIIGANMRPFGNQCFSKTHRGGSGHRIRVWLKGQTQDSDFLILYGIQSVSDFVDQAIGEVM